MMEPTLLLHLTNEHTIDCSLPASSYEGKHCYLNYLATNKHIHPIFVLKVT